MDEFLNTPYENPQRRQSMESHRWIPDNGQLLDLADLQFAVAPNCSASHDRRSNYTMYNEQQHLDSLPNGTKDLFLETFDFLGTPIEQGVSPFQDTLRKGTWAEDADEDPLYGKGLNLNEGLDSFCDANLLVLPEYSNSSAKNNGANKFSSAQNFSPNSRGANFVQLNSIVEGTLSPSYYSNTFSPVLSRHGSVSMIPPSSSYLLQHTILSPQSKTHDGSYETLILPYSGSYVNSPLAMSHSNSLNLKLSYSGSNTNGNLPIQANNVTPCSTGSPSAGPSSVPSVSSSLLRKATEQSSTPKQLTADEKAKRRREFHNAVERRRRDLIKEKIKVLGFLVPSSLLTPQACAIQALLKNTSLNIKETKDLIASVRMKDSKPNKAFILQTSVEYIHHLHHVLEEQSAKREELEHAIAKLDMSSSGSEANLETAGSGTSNDCTFLSSNFNPDEFFSVEI